MFALRESADEDRLAQIEEALAPPPQFRHGGSPVWYGSDDDAWEEFERQSRKAAPRSIGSPRK